MFQLGCLPKHIATGMSTNSRGLKHGNFKSNWPTCLSPCGQSATQPKFAQFWGVRRSRAVLFVVSKRVGAIVGLLFLATAATARMRKVFGPKLLKWWLLKTRQIYMSCSPSGNCKGMYRRCLLSPQTFRYSFRKNLYQNQMHAGRFSTEGCISKETSSNVISFWLGHDPLPSTDNNPSA